MDFSTERTAPFAYDHVSQAWKPSTAAPVLLPLIVGQVFRIISWNIDFMEPFQPERVAAALKYLENFLRDKPEPTTILLQEIMGASLDTLLASLWVKNNFQISHLQPKQHPAYFTITLIPKNIEVISVFRVPLVMTYMGRDGLFVDLPISRSSMVDRDTKYVVRICNTHLESLQSGNSVRPLQLTQISSLLRASHSSDTEIVAGLVGGDMNAISHNDEGLHHRPEIDLQDVYEIAQRNAASLGNSGDDGLGGEKGYTWGYQPRCQYPPGRLDKIMFIGMLRPTAVGGEPCVVRLGVGLQVKVRDPEPSPKPSFRSLGRAAAKGSRDFERAGAGQFGGSDEEDWTSKEVEVWVTDHFGISTTFTVLNQQDS